MITYQVKITVNQDIQADWLQWMKTVHVPDVIATGLIRSFQILKPQDGEARTYYFNYHFNSQEDFIRYQKEFSPALKEDVINRYPDQFKASRQIFDWI